MAGDSVAEGALAAGSRVGRYFGLVSALPSALFVLFIYVLFATGAWNGAPDLSKLSDAIGDISLGQASVLILLSFGLGLVLHPLQFALTQLLEGYWGTNLVARRLAVARIRHPRGRADFYERAFGTAASTIEELGRDTLHGTPGDPWLWAIVDEQAYQGALQSYPERGDRILPTRLGNAMRRFEDDAGAQYGLDALTVVPHLSLTAEPTHAVYLRDAREQLDLAVRLCALCLLATGFAFALLVTDGPWLLITLIPYGLGYLFYRGTIVAAQNLGAAVAAIIDLDRFGLYAWLHLPMPIDTVAERQNNATLTGLLQFKTTLALRYEHPST